MTHRPFETLILSQKAVRAEIPDPLGIYGKSGRLLTGSNPLKDFLIGRNVHYCSFCKLTERQSFGKIKINNTRPASQRCAPGGFFVLWAGQ